MKYQGIIFDLDGVLCSTDEYHYQAWKTLADQLNIPFDRERNNLLRGVSRMESLSIILEKSGKTYSDQEKQAFAEQKNALYRTLLRQMSPADVSDEVRKTLHFLRESGLKLAVGSSSKNTPFILERIGLSNFFDTVADGLVVEDAHAGVEAAVSGGFDCAAIGDARDDPRAAWRLQSLSELCECLG